MRIIDNNELLNNSLIIHEELKKIITILTSIVKLYPLDLLTKLGLNLKIELHKCSECFSFYNNDFYPDITSKVVYKGDEIMRLIL